MNTSLHMMAHYVANWSHQATTQWCSGFLALWMMLHIGIVHPDAANRLADFIFIFPNRSFAQHHRVDSGLARLASTPVIGPMATEYGLDGLHPLALHKACTQLCSYETGNAVSCIWMNDSDMQHLPQPQAKNWTNRGASRPTTMHQKS